MIVVEGKYNTAKIFTETVEEKATEQIKALCDDKAFQKSKIRIMPDVHAGAGCTIGTTMTITDKAVPNMVGVDIGCGIELAKLKEKTIDFKKLDRLIHDNVPAGRNARKNPHAYAKNIALEALKCFSYIKSDLACHSVGTLGGGNHFIEVDTDEKGVLYLAIHSGSRHLGLEVAEHYQRIAYENFGGNPDTAYVAGEAFDDYIHDMKIVQQFAVWNRQAILDEIVSGMGLTVLDSFTTIHNYIDTDRMILRKGAVSARKGERLLIPINMRDGALICEGKGNPDWNESAPHGAGRLLSRSKAYATLSLKEYEKQMAGIYTTSVCKNTLDESPMAYKRMEDIIGNIQPTVKITNRIKPVYNFKSAN